MTTPVDAVGNVVLAPGASRRPFTNDVELLASTAVQPRQAGVSLKTGQGFLLVGTPLKKDTATGYYVPTANDGTAAEGFLRTAVDTGVAGQIPKLGNIVTHGILKYSVIKSALAALGATTPALATGALTGLGARVDVNRDELHVN